MNRPPRKLRKASKHSASTSASASATATTSSNRDHHYLEQDREEDRGSVLSSEFGALSRISSFEIISHPRSHNHPHHPAAGSSSSVSQTHAHRQRQRLERLQRLSIASLSVSPLSPLSGVSSPFQVSPASTISPIGLIPSIPSMHWLFRSNLPSKNRSLISASEDSTKAKKKGKKVKSLRQSLFGVRMGSRNASSVQLSEPPQPMSRSITETKNLLAEARRELRQLEAQMQAQESQEHRHSASHSRSKSQSGNSHDSRSPQKPSRVARKTATIKSMPPEMYFHRLREEEVLTRMLNPERLVPLGGQPTTGRGLCQWIVVAGAEGCGKTSLLHQILAPPQGPAAVPSAYLTLHLDLRFSPFGAGDMEGLYMCLNGLMVGFWEEVAWLGEQEGMGEGWEMFDLVAQAFKHDKTAVERRLRPSTSPLTSSSTSLQPGHSSNSEKRALPKSQSTTGTSSVKTSDIARLMEMFKGGLAKYWDFEPSLRGPNPHRPSSKLGNSGFVNGNGGSEATSSSRTKVEGEQELNPNATEEGKIGRSGSRRWGFMAFGSTGRLRGGGGSRRDRRGRNSRDVRGSEETTVEREQEKGKEREHSTDDDLGGGKSGRWMGKKKVPVIFIDEAHKLPHLIPADTLKCLLDSLLVLTKQNRLCHVVQASSDPFYQSWLRSLGVLSGCKILTLGDLNKHDTRRFYREHVFPRVPERMRGPLNFEVLWDAFGGRMIHWMDYVEEFVGSGGVLDVKQSSHFLQAHTLLNLHIIHASQAPGSNDPGNPDQGHSAGGSNGNTSMSHPNMSNTDTRTLHPGLGAAGFKAYAGYGMGGGMEMSFGSGLGLVSAGVGFPNLGPSAQPAPPSFTAMQLLKVISRLSLATTGLSQDGTTTIINPGGEPYLAYFHLCRELGVRAVDGMVRGGVLDLRWSECVAAGAPMSVPPINPSLGGGMHTRDSTMVGPGPGPVPPPIMPVAHTTSTQTNLARQQSPPSYLAPPDRGRRTPASAFDADSAHAASPAAVVALSVAAGVAGVDDEDDYDMVPIDVDVDEDAGDDDEVVMARQPNPASIPLPPSVAPSIMFQSTTHLPLPATAPPPVPPLPQVPPADPQYPTYQPYQLPANLPSQPQYRDSEYYPHGHNPNEDVEGEVVGPKLLPITPIMRYAMREVVQEYEDDQSVSEYASLSDVDEY